MKGGGYMYDVASKCIQSVRGCARSGYGSFKDVFESNPLSDNVRKTTLKLIVITVIVTIVYLALWVFLDPFGSFSATVFKHAGLTGSTLNADEVFNNFNMWSTYGIIGAGTVLVSFGIQCVRNSIWQRTNWHKGAVPLLSFGMVCMALGLMLPPYMFMFSDGFKVLLSPNNTILQSDPEIISMIDQGIGTGFSAIAFTWYSIIFSQLIEGVPAGLFIAYTLFEMDNVERESTGRIQAGRNLAVLWGAQLVCPLTQLLAAIVLYQVTGGSAGFATLWLLKWTVPLMLVKCTTCAIMSGTPQNPRRPYYLLCVYFMLVLGFVAGILKYLTNDLLRWEEAVFLVMVFLVTCFSMATISYITLHKEYDIDSEFELDWEHKAINPSSGINDDADDTDNGDTQHRRQQQHYSHHDYHHESTLDTTDNSDGSTTTIFINNQPHRLSFRNTEAATGTDRLCSATPQKDKSTVPENPTVYQRLWMFLWEIHEHENPQLYGKRVPYRRVSYLLAVVMLGVFVCNALISNLGATPDEEMKSLLRLIDPNLVMPKNGTGFDNLLQLYINARNAADIMALVAWSLLFSGLILESFPTSIFPAGLGIKISRSIAAVAMVGLSASMVIPAAPNYVRALNTTQICPECSPLFDTFVDHLIGEMVGLVCSTFFAGMLLVMLLCIPMAIARVVRYMIDDPKLASWVTTPIQKRIYERNLMVTFTWASLLTPLLCCLPTMIFVQFFGDYYVAALLLCFYVLPISVAFLARRNHILKFVIAYYLCYFLPLCIILGYEAHKHGLADAIVKQLKNPMNYVEFVAEVSLTNVVVGDLLYACIVD
jgi:hypothetical protein